MALRSKKQMVTWSCCHRIGVEPIFNHTHLFLHLQKLWGELILPPTRNPTTQISGGHSTSEVWSISSSGYRVSRSGKVLLWTPQLLSMKSCKHSKPWCIVLVLKDLHVELQSGVPVGRMEKMKCNQEHFLNHLDVVCVVRSSLLGFFRASLCPNIMQEGLQVERERRR